jgi:asparagine synthetase B (glutamine-hydrolysing)
MLSTLDVSNHLIGGFLPKQIVDQIISSQNCSESCYTFHDHVHQHSKSSVQMFFHIQSNHFIKTENSRYIIIGLGHISNHNGDVGEVVLRKILDKLQHNSRLPIKNLEGSFSIIVIDKTKNKIRIYRNIAGFPCIYYVCKDQLTVFSDDISYLAHTLSSINQQHLALNNSKLPSHFFKLVIGRDTLFKDIYRTCVGEQISLEENKISRIQLLTLSDMIRSQPKNCTESLQQTMNKVIKEYTKTYGDVVNMFSGGVDSSYVQYHLSQCLDYSAKTFSVDVISPSEKWKIEREYARSGVSFFQTRHTFVSITPSEYPDLLMKTISEVGQPVCNLQRALAFKLFNSVKSTSNVVLCGMCADAIFGMEDSINIDIAHLIKKLIPFNFAHNFLLKIVKTLNKKFDRYTLTKLATILDYDLDDYSSPKHPINMYSSEGFELARKLFGPKESQKVLARGQALMKKYKITGSLKERLHSIILLYCVHGTSEELYRLASNAGLRLIFPFLDSRIIKTALSMRDSRFHFGKTKKVLKDALINGMPKKLVLRKKSAWGLPIHEWIVPGGVLYPLVKDMENSSLSKSLKNLPNMPDAFIWNLLIFQIWHKEFFGKYL